MDNETIKTARAIDGNKGDKATDIDKRRTATKFIWMPGMRPVMVPIAIPTASAIISSKIMV